MGDNSPKDKNKKKKQHDREVTELNRARQEKIQRDKAASQPPNDGRKAS